MFAQTTKADRLFENWEYHKASELYQKETEKNPSADVYYKLGECYRKMNSYKKEEQAADDKVNSYGTYKIPQFYLNYGHVLRNNGQYEKAKVAYDTYSSLVPSDPQGKFYSESIDIVNEDHKTDVSMTVTNVKALNSKNADFCPVIYKDGIVFTSSRKTPGHGKTYAWTGANYLDMYSAKKGSKETDFTNVEPFEGKKNNKKYNDGPACFSKNFDTIYISRVEKYLEGDEKKTLKIERNKIFIATCEDGKWQKAEPFVVNSDNFSVANPTLSADGKKMYFVSDMPGGFGRTDIYYCNKEGENWSKPINMGPAVNTFGSERYPYVDEAGNFYFSSDGYQGLGGMDVCVALNKDNSLQKAKPMKSPVNSTYDDNGILFLKAEKTGYITSNRIEGGQGDDDILFFDFSNSDVNASEYTVGYQPKVIEEVVENPVVDSVPVKEDPIIIAVAPVDTEIYFDFAKYDIRYDAIKTLDSVANYMKASPDLKLVLAGHTDSRGENQYNLYLSIFRNNSVIKYLGDKGISEKRIEAVGYGASQLENSCRKGVKCSDSQHQANRNVMFHFEKFSDKKENTTYSKMNANQIEHVVKKNETVYSISKMHNMSVENLKKINNMNNDVIVPGQILIVNM